MQRQDEPPREGGLRFARDSISNALSGHYLQRLGSKPHDVTSLRIRYGRSRIGRLSRLAPPSLEKPSTFAVEGVQFRAEGAHSGRPPAPSGNGAYFPDID